MPNRRKASIGVALALSAAAAAVLAPLGGPECEGGRCPSTPRLTEIEPVAALPPPPAASDGDPRLESAALGVLRSERSAGRLAEALGATSVEAVQVGRLEARGRQLGATMLVDLARPRQDLWATVPAYVPAEGGSGAYTTQSIRMHVAVLRDALIDVDLDRGRVIAFEPGPRSRCLSWSPLQAPASARSWD
jgi:hypothetical protein